MTLTDFLLARIAEDEASARAAFDDLTWSNDEDQVGTGWSTSRGYEHNHLSDPSSVFTRGWSPERVLVECEAKRRIVEAHRPDRHLENWYWTDRKCAECGRLWHKIPAGQQPTEIGPEQGCPTLRALAAIYADHADYEERWNV